MTMTTKNNLQEKLYSAVQAGDASAVADYLARGASANFTCSAGKTCLGAAAYIGNIQILKLLLDNINSKGRNDDCIAREPLNCNVVPYRCECKSSMNLDLQSCYDERNRAYYVFINGDTSPADLSPELQSGMDALEWDEEVGIGADSTVEDEKWTELYRWYARMLEQTEGLLGTENENVIPYESIRDSETQDVCQRTAAHYAAEQGHSAALRLLSQAGCKIDSYDITGFTPLHLAATSGHRASVRVLILAGADVNKYSLNAQQFTALHLAAACGHHHIVEILLTNNVAIEAKDGEDRTSLLIAAKNDFKSVVNILLHAKANSNAEDIKGSTPLCEAVWNNNVEIVKDLIEYGARSPPHRLLLHYAVLNKQVEIARALLLQARNYVDLRDDNGDTPLLLAARSGQPHLLQLLLDNGASVNFPNSLTGSTALHEAVECVTDFSVFQDIFIRLLKHNANLNVISIIDGDTPLCRAIIFKRDEAAKLLIRHGADVNIPLQYFLMDNVTLALEKNNISLANLLMLAGAPVPSSSAAHNPRPLAHIARLSLRTALRSTSLFQSVAALPLPNQLKGFLMLENEE